MQEAVAGLVPLARAWSRPSEVGEGGEEGGIEEVDWHIKSLDFQEALRARDMYVHRLGRMVCVECEDFDEHVSALVRLPTYH